MAVQDSVWSLIFISHDPVDANIFRRGGINLFPLYLYPKEEVKGAQKEFLETSYCDSGKDGRVPNLSREFKEELCRRIKLEFVSDGRGDLKSTFGPEV